jgi:hypothetical protein
MRLRSLCKNKCCKQAGFGIGRVVVDDMNPAVAASKGGNQRQEIKRSQLCDKEEQCMETSKALYYRGQDYFGLIGGVE